MPSTSPMTNATTTANPPTTSVGRGGDRPAVTNGPRASTEMAATEVAKVSTAATTTMIVTPAQVPSAAIWTRAPARRIGRTVDASGDGTDEPEVASDGAFAWSRTVTLMLRTSPPDC